MLPHARFGERTYSGQGGSAPMQHNCCIDAYPRGDWLGGYMGGGRPLYYINEEMLAYLGVHLR